MIKYWTCRKGKQEQEENKHFATNEVQWPFLSDFWNKRETNIRMGQKPLFIVSSLSNLERGLQRQPEKIRNFTSCSKCIWSTSSAAATVPSHRKVPIFYDMGRIMINRILGHQLWLGQHSVSSSSYFQCYTNIS